MNIGYHYVALDANGNPIDSNGNGTPDYLEDSAGSGQMLTINLITPLNNSYFPEPANILLQATVFDWSAVVTNVVFIHDSNQITSLASAPFQFTWPIVGAGSYSLSAVAYDSAGLSATNSSIVTTTVTNLCTY